MDNFAVEQFLPLAQAAPGGDAGSLMSMLPMFAVMIAVLYFLMIRPQQKKEKQKAEMMGALAKGDQVVTIGGICGTVADISENHVVVKVDDNTKIEFLKSAIHTRVAPDKKEKK